jgi:hypothetical protein
LRIDKGAVRMTSESNAIEEIAEPAESATSRWVWAFGSYLVALSLTIFYLLFRLWPGQIPIRAEHLPVTIIPRFLVIDVWTEARFLALVALAGALGSYIHLATSFADYAGNRQLVKSWQWWYVLRPFIGSALALVVYFAVRGGLIAGASGAENLSPYGLSALAGLTGMFSKQATEKLREIFENLFKSEQPPRADPLASEQH